MNDQERLLTIFLRLQLGTSFEKKQLAQEFEVSEKTIQRDFSLLRDILSSNTSYSGDFLYNRKTNKYCLASKSVFNKKDILIKEKFFNLFNSQHFKNKQMVFSSDTEPDQLENVPSRLIVRFKWGMTVCLASIEG